MTWVNLALYSCVWQITADNVETNQIWSFDVKEIYLVASVLFSS